MIMIHCYSKFTRTTPSAMAWSNDAR